MPHHYRHKIIFGIIVLAALHHGVALASPLPQVSGSLVEITAPVDGSTVTGNIQIIGSVMDPGFMQYELAITPASEEVWQDIQPPISQQVQNGILGQWATASVADGSYRIRLRMVRQNGSSEDAMVNVIVSNATATPEPTATLPASATPIEPSATVLIWQPPTRTPRPTSTPGGPTPTPESLTYGDSPFRPEKLANAAWNGALTAFIAFALLALYSIGRAARRGQLGSWWQTFLRDYVYVLIDAIRRRSK